MNDCGCFFYYTIFHSKTISQQVDATVQVGLGGIQDISAQLEQKLSEVSHSLAVEKRAKAVLKGKLQYTKLSLSNCKAKLTKLYQKRRQDTQELEILQLQLRHQTEKTSEETEELKLINQKKEVEIARLKDSLKELKCEIESAKQETQTFREKLATKELELKCLQVQELERKKCELEGELDLERRRVDLLITQQSPMSEKMRVYIVEDQVSLSTVVYICILIYLISIIALFMPDFCVRKSPT